MLSHYSDHHKGIVIEYQCNQPNLFQSVKYNPTYKHFCYDQILNNFIPRDTPRGIEINNEVLKPLLFKFQEWNYQNEHRIFSSLPHQTKNISEFGLKITRIYFGTRVERRIALSFSNILRDESIEYLFLNTPLSHDTTHRVTITSDKAGVGACSKKCFSN